MAVYLWEQLESVLILRAAISLLGSHGEWCKYLFFLSKGLCQLLGLDKYIADI